MNRIPLGLRLAALCLLTICRPAISQDYLTATGNPSFSVNIPVENGFINVANGNLHMEFPLATHKQRGALALDEKLVYDSRIWMIGHYNNYYWWPTNVPNTTLAQGGWRFVTGAETGTITYTLNSGTTQGTCQAPNRGPTGTQDNYVYTISWSDPSGTNHIFDASLFDDENTCGYPTSRTIDGGYATDASGYYVSGDSNGNAVVVDKNGTQVYPEVIDRYGNYWSLDNNENLIDDLGRTPVIATTNGNVTYYDVLAPNGPINNNGTRVRYTVTTTPIQVSTQFNETGVVEWSGTLSPISSIQLPDGSSYRFSYDSYGEMTSVTLPTGGVITYGWGNYFDSYQNENRWLTSRTVGNNPAMTFTPSVITQCSSGGTGCQEQMVVHKPSGDETVYTLTLNNGAWNTNTTAYTGSHLSGTPLMNVVNTYDFSNPCPSQICIGANDITKSTAVTTLSDTGLMTQTQYGYNDPYLGNLTSLKQWDYYTGSPSATPTHETDYVYSGYDLTQSTSFYNGTQVAQITYGYTPSPTTTTSGIAQHGTTNAGGPYLQTVSQWINTGGSSTTIYAMDDTGMVTSIKDPKGNLSSTSYQCANALPYQSTNALSQTTTYGYDCNSGAITSVKDPNDSAAGRSGTTYSYEAVAGRSWTIGRPDGGTTTYSYPSSTEVDTAVTATPDPTISSQDISDAFGRTYQHIQAGISTEIAYDANGRKSCVTNPHVIGTPSSTDGSTCITVYDGLDRPKKQTQPDGSTLTWNYTGNVTSFSDEASNTWSRTSNAFGQLTNVVEPGNLQTSYSYDGLGNLVTAIQAGGSGDTSRTRTFSYDSLSRMLSSAIPESGTTSYSYVANGSLCAGDVSLPCSKTDARGTTINYAYDALNRLTGKTYSDGTPNVAYTYDSFSGWGQPHGASIGRLVRALTCNASSQCNDDLYSYDPMGRINHLEGATPSEAGHAAHWTQMQYDLAGNLTALLYPDGHVINQTFDGAGRLSNVIYASQSTPYGSFTGGTIVNIPYISAINYFADGSPLQTTFGNGMVETLNKNSRLQIQSLTAWNPTSPYNSQPFLAHTYCYVNCATGGTANNGNIWGITDTLNPSQTQGFTYDALNRISSFSLGGAISQQYKIDSFGNMSPMSGTNPVFSFDPATNRINNLPCAASLAPYDTVGNQICDTDNNGALRQYSFDAENRISQIAMLGSGTPFETYFYDGDGNRVRKANANGNFTEYVYFNGQPIAETDQSGAWTDYIYANGRKIAMDTVASTIWMHGSNQTPVEAAVNLALPGVINISTGDKLSWYQYQQSSGGTTGGMNLIFDNGWQLNGACTSCSGQPAAALDQNDVAVDKWSGNFGWEWRTVDLSAYAGHSISGAQLLKDVGAPSDSWDLLFSFISITHADGRVDTIYDGINQIGLSMPAVAGLENNWASYNGVIGSVQTRYYVDDHLGTTQMEFSAGGYPLWKGQFAPFGQELDTQYTANHYKFTGLEHDSESGLDHTQFRQYGSTMGRWMSPDPYNGSMDLANPQSFNRYSYVGNMPMRFIDPSGQIPCVPVADPGITIATCVAITATETCGPVCGAVAGGAAFIGAVVADLFTGGFFAHPTFHGSLQPRPNSPNSGQQPDKKPCSAKLAQGVQSNTGTSISNVQSAGSIGGHANYTFDVADPSGFQSILNQNPAWPLPFGIDQGSRYGLVGSTHIENTLTGGFIGHTDLFNGHSFLAPLHWLVDVGVGHIPGVNLDFGCKAGL
ncbi:RHS repeat-associated core domain-containing protein [Edaphobacter dinghuensis]|uniref:RHS repeat-associated protein n=1 Tax=Edaphobacter dinghuensis TaxID=1560005 RepID=A0A917HD05_9BACT|nr:RHS repeat-associated core domain-containing protein [Edaphobacter dinghuensis]GGG75787.1 hypothetical protein GCM10011585_18310 [Edaphobacter dinghuensis]